MRVGQWLAMNLAGLRLYDSDCILTIHQRGEVTIGTECFWRTGMVNLQMDPGNSVIGRLP